MLSHVTWSGRWATVGVVILGMGLLGSDAALGQSGTRGPTPSPARSHPPASPETPAAGVALEGYCPVCVVQMGQWVRGNPSYQATYDGKTYYFPGQKQREMFLADPVKYVPALGGDCTVCLAKMGKRVPGNIRYAAIHQGRLYLFPSDQQKQMFLADPAAFADADLALGGNCAVCLSEMGKQVPGKPEFTVIYHGLRYQFLSDRQRQMFLAEPDKYATDGKTAAATASASHPSHLVSVVGTSGCAACEHGVTPLGSPDTLGLAVSTADGKVYVVEDADRLYPQVYNNRFAGLRVKVSGEVLKEQGKIVWLRPSELEVLN